MAGKRTDRREEEDEEDGEEDEVRRADDEVVDAKDGEEESSAVARSAASTSVAGRMVWRCTYRQCGQTAMYVAERHSAMEWCSSEKYSIQLSE